MSNPSCGAASGRLTVPATRRIEVSLEMSEKPTTHPIARIGATVTSARRCFLEANGRRFVNISPRRMNSITVMQTLNAGSSSPSKRKADLLPMWLIIQLKFMPKTPVRKVIGRKITVTTVSLEIWSLCCWAMLAAKSCMMLANHWLRSRNRCSRSYQPEWDLYPDRSARRNRWQNHGDSYLPHYKRVRGPLHPSGFGATPHFETLCTQRSYDTSYKLPVVMLGRVVILILIAVLIVVVLFCRWLARRKWTPATSRITLAAGIAAFVGPACASLPYTSNFQFFPNSFLGDVWFYAAIGAIGIGIGVFAFSKGSKIAGTICFLTNIPVLAYWGFVAVFFAMGGSR